MVKKLLLLVMFLFLGIIAKAQEYFYYHQGEKIYLELDFNRVAVNTGQNSYDYIRSKHKDVTFSDIKQDYDKNRLINRNGINPDLDDAFYFEIISTNIRTTSEYFNFIDKINKETQTI